MQIPHLMQVDKAFDMCYGGCHVGTKGLMRFNFLVQIECLPTCCGKGPQFEPVLCHEYLESKYAATHSKFANAAAA